MKTESAQTGSPASTRIGPEHADLDEVFRLKYGDPATTGWSPRMRYERGYFTPEDHYEALVSTLVTESTTWLDVGCGRFLFPGNEALARKLSGRCSHLTGVDPDATILENPYVHEKAQETIDAYRADRGFDLVTLRMVAEHLTDPDAAVASLQRLVVPGGRVVVYTVYKWSPIPLLTRITPFGLHHPIKRLVWGTEEKDTFPVANRMNTRGDLREVFGRHGFREAWFRYADDCRTFAGWRATQWIELACWRVLRAVGLHYPEVCLLGVYERRSDS